MEEIEVVQKHKREQVFVGSMKLTVEKVHEIAEELRTTREKTTGKMAFDFIWNKYKNLFVCFEQFMRCMSIESVFFSCRPDVEEIRIKTEYKYV